MLLPKSSGLVLTPGTGPIQGGNMSKEFLVDEILPVNEVHLLAGPSGSGKTTWILNALKREWEKGEPFLGYQSYPAPWAYAPADRSLDSVMRTLKRIKIDPGSIDIIAAYGEDKRSFTQIIDVAETLGAKLLVIEAFGHFVEEMIGTPNGKNVGSFLSTTRHLIKKADLTIIGVVESPKMKPYERYENPRQRISGAAAWAHFSETIFLMERQDPQDPSNTWRRLYLCPRNAPDEILTGRLMDGEIFFYRGEGMPASLDTTTR